jgi:hypothetical protein
VVARAVLAPAAAHSPARPSVSEVPGPRASSGGACLPSPG